MRSNPSQNPASLYLRLFFIFIVIVTLITCAIRTIQIFRNKTFNEKSYTVALIGDTTSEVVSFIGSGEARRVVKLHINNTENDLSQLSLFEKSVALGVPLSASISTNKNSSELFTFSNSLSVFLGRNNYESQRIGDADYIFIYLSLKKINENKVEQKNIDYKDIQAQTIDPQEFTNLFKNESVFNQKISVSVINASGVPGLAKRVANMLEATGYYVINVDSDELKNESSVIINNNTEDFIFSYLFDSTPIVTGRGGIEDVHIVLGKDIIKKH